MRTALRALIERVRTAWHNRSLPDLATVLDHEESMKRSGGFPLHVEKKKSGVARWIILGLAIWSLLFITKFATLANQLSNNRKVCLLFLIMLSGIYFICKGLFNTGPRTSDK